MFEILSRLSLNAIFSGNCVCKSWQKDLTELHFSRKSPSASESSAAMGFSDQELRFGNSCKELVSLCNQTTGAPIRVWNRDLNEIVYNLSEVNLISPSRGASGLGFVPKTNEYKVVWIQAHSWEAEMLTLGEDNWRRLGRLPCQLDCNYHLSAGTFFKGALHWVVKDHDSELVFTIDMETEKFNYLPPPPGFFLLSPASNRYLWSNLGVFQGCLYICAGDVRLLNPNIEVWIMKDYGFKESWFKDFTLKNPVIEWWNPYRSIKLVEFNKENGELQILCADHDRRLTYKADCPQNVHTCCLHEHA
ncbi:hypothetical protein DITRI_Ditri13aG0137700 [Diplodiscus trichospermus]